MLNGKLGNKHIYKNVTLDLIGTQHVKVCTTGKEKDNFTVWLAAYINAVNGRDDIIVKMPPHLIWKADALKGQVYTEVTAAASKYKCTANVTKNGWSTGQSFLEWGQQYLTTDVYPPMKTLFIVDLHTSHRTDELLAGRYGGGAEPLL